MALNSLGLGFVFSAKDVASPVMKKVEGRFRKLDRATEEASARTRKGLTSVRNTGLAVGIAGGLAMRKMLDVSDTAGQFSQRLVAANTKFVNSSANDLDSLEKKAFAVAKRTKFAPLEIAEGFEAMSTLGVDAADAIELIDQSANLAVSSQINLADASKAILGTVKAFGLSATDAKDVADKLTIATQNSALQGADFEIAYSKASGTMQQFGQNMDDTLVILGLLRDLNIDASSSGTALRESIRRLGSDQRVQNKVAKLGVKLVDDTTGKMRPLNSIMLDLIDSTRDMTVTEKGRISNLVFGARGLLSAGAIEKARFTTIQDGRKITLAGRDAIVARMMALQDATKGEGAAARTVRELNDTFKGQKDILGGVVKALETRLGQALNTVLKPIVEDLNDGIGSLIEKFESLPKSTREFLAKGALVAATAFTVGGALLVLLGTVGLLTTGMGGLGVALTALGSAFTPILVIGGVLALFRLAVAENIGGLGDIFDASIGDVASFWDRLRTWFVENDVLEKSKTLFEAFVRGVKDGLRSLDPAIRVAVVGFKLVKAVVVGIVDLFLGDGKSSMKDLEGTAKSLGEAAAVVAGAFLAWKLRIVGLMLVQGLFNGLIITARALTWGYRTAIWAVKAAQFLWALMTNATVRAQLVQNALILVGRVRMFLMARATAVAALAQKAYNFMAKGGVKDLRSLKGAAGAARSSYGKLAGSLAGRAGLVGAAAAAGLAVGSLANEFFGADEWAAALLGDVTGLTAWLNNLDEAAGGRTKKRGAAFLGGDDNPNNVMAAGRRTSERGRKSPTVDTVGDVAFAQAQLSAANVGGRSPSIEDFMEVSNMLSDILKNNANFVLNIDGRKVAEANMRGQRSNDSLAFGATPTIGEE